MDFLYILRAVFEITVLWVIFYQLYRAFKDSRSAAILAGLVIILLVSVVVLRLAHASVLQHIAASILGPGTILVVLFQDELRTALAKLGTLPHLRRFYEKRQGSGDFLSRVIDSVSYLSSKHYGALIVICRQNKLAEIVERGTLLDAIYTRELIGSIFMPKTLLHDGAVIVNHERIAAAACILPVAEHELKDTSMGLRHRAGIGMAEKSDAVVIIVSEETGTISLAEGNTLQRNLSRDMLRKRLTELLYAQNIKSVDEDQGSNHD